ncbi:MAG TPA: right-handed parallel beta-helix repeat-containing protein [bacterium]|nr:right-handed parallel beta-helix repeat-containing protein [bacterium]
MLRKLISIPLALALSAGAVFAAVDIRAGNIVTDTTWKRTGGPVNIYGDVAIENGATLTIEAGVDVRFYEVKGTGGYEDGAELVVRKGTLVAEGKTGLPVKFTSANGVKKMGDWGAVVVEGSNQIILENAIIEFATNGLRLANVNSIGSSRSSFEGTIIRYCLNNGVLAYNSRAKLYHLTVEHNGYAGVKTLWNCFVTANYCDLCNNDGMWNFYNGSSNNVDATNCWWGSADPSFINRRIYDYHDNRAKGEVDYSPYLTGPWREGGKVPNYSLGFLKTFFK